MSEVNTTEAASPTPPRATPGRGRRLTLLLILAVVAVPLAVWGFNRWRHARTHVSTENAQIDGHIVPVLAKVGGYVDQVLVVENQRVHRGDTLVVIDDVELRARLAEAEANLAAARAAVGSDDTPGQVDADVSASRARRQAAEARLTAAEARRDHAVADLARIRELTDKQITSRQQLDAAQAAADAANADVSAAQREIAAGRAAEVAAGAAGRAAEAGLARAEVAVERARLDLSYASVVAPISGVVSKVGIEIGQLLQPGQPLGAVVDDASLWVTANLKETETSEVHAGQAVAIDVDAYPGCEAQGSVESVSPATGSKFALLPPDNATGNFTKVVQRIPVRIAIEEGCGDERALRPGLSVVAHIAVR